MFTQNFPGAAENRVEDGASIECIVDGVRYVAMVRADDDQSKPEDRQDGFWPSRDPSAPGYIGENPERSFKQQMNDCEEVMRRWRDGELIYCGVCLAATKADVTLLEPYAVALWGVEVNWPPGDNSYLLTVANELLPEAIAAVKERAPIKIAELELTLAELREVAL